jgi:pSer/pThr/pTyr-binding forkhead associated (FHA) protein
MLRIHFSDNRQAPVWLVEERFTIGRDSRNNLVLPDPGIAPFHAEIRQDQGFYYLSDVSSQGDTGGVSVNDERVAARFQLRPNDRVRVGAVEMLLVDPARSKVKSEATARWFVQVISGEHEGKKFHINGSMTFGRSSKCELCFSDSELSRRHCEFYLKDDVLEVKDLASANGVMVNQQAVGTAVLQPGDQVKMGSVKLLVIGPKVAVAQAEDEDATVFMRAVEVQKPLRSSPPPRSATREPVARANPLHAAAQVGSAAKTASATSGNIRFNRPWLIIVVAIGLLGVVAVLALAQLF